MIRAPELASMPNVRHGFFTRENGVSSGLYESLNVGLGSKDDRDNVLENRRRVAERLGVDGTHLATPYQIHSPDVLVLDAPLAEDAAREADALVTATPGLAIGVLSADCGPILFADPEAGVIGAAHAGWRGAFGGVLKNTIAAMEGLGAHRSAIVAVLGPTITQPAYEVGPEFKDQFLSLDGTFERYFSPSARETHAQFNLPAFILDLLKAEGVQSASFVERCTYAEPEKFFSYRRSTHKDEPDYGRQISAIVLA
ncbi:MULTISPECIES: peptidoglycan editing factor PgeF [Pseudovibrio]|uniref:peptidoglycan editing factor PgeF n=1 Tax=Stappiaceae TaxID=2821832 RepID=UPI002366F1F4|nr:MULTISPECIES: peptidoglycan editing factor PgeF [Pseudovibrio]MDD7910198.1 peptidoglycan editing factor PgeF [Pseudovibrio exalbescens]MDX5593911.1 peptidoglycan editing factor PgeF [Pseudovibrio sp. SPO723]